ncbi:aspartyl protease family protein [Luteimonas sp. A478]
MRTVTMLFIAALLGAAGADARAATRAPAACALVDADNENFQMQVPFGVVDGRIYVDARANGRGPFRFAVDTGASGVGRADATLVTQLGLEITGTARNSDGLQTAEAQTTRLDSLELGGLSHRAVDVITRDYSSHMSPEAPFHGIIGREFFADGLLVIDYPARTLSFSRTLSISPRDEGALEYERPFRVPVSIGNVRTQGNLDTGANVSFVLPQALYERVASGPLEPAGAGGLTNTRLETSRAVVGGPFHIGAASVRDIEVRVSDRYPELLVGAHVLQDFVVLIDQGTRAVALCDPRPRR